MDKLNSADLRVRMSSGRDFDEKRAAKGHLLRRCHGTAHAAVQTLILPSGPAAVIQVLPRLQFLLRRMLPRESGTTTGRKNRSSNGKHVVTFTSLHFYSRYQARIQPRASNQGEQL